MNFPTVIKPGDVSRLLDENPLSAGAYESEGGLWQIALNPTVMGSIRLNISHRDWPGEHITVWCLGESPLVHLTMVSIVKKWMEGLAEDLAPSEFRKIVPDHSWTEDANGHRRQLRPITTDPLLVMKLAELAGFDDAAVRTAARLVCGPICCEPAAEDFTVIEIGGGL